MAIMNRNSVFRTRLRQYAVEGGFNNCMQLVHAWPQPHPAWTAILELSCYGKRSRCSILGSHRYVCRPYFQFIWGRHTSKVMIYRTGPSCGLGRRSECVMQGILWTSPVRPCRWLIGSFRLKPCFGVIWSEKLTHKCAQLIDHPPLQSLNR